MQNILYIQYTTEWKSEWLAWVSENQQMTKVNLLLLVT